MPGHQYVYVIFKRDAGPKSKPNSGAIKQVHYYGQPADVKPPDDGHGVIELFTQRRFDAVRWRVEEGRVVEVKVRTRFVKSRLSGGGGEARSLNIVLVSDCITDPTGFGGQAGHLYRGLTGKGHNVHALRFDEIDTLLNLRFDWIISLGDYYQVAKIAEMGEEVTSRWIHWLPVSSEDIEEGFWERVKIPGRLVAMSRFGAQALAKHGLTGASCIPHGIEMDTFKPLVMQEVDRLRKMQGLDGKFAVLYVGRNTKRKRVDHLLEIFARVLRAIGNDAPIKFLLKTEEKYSHISVTEHAAKLDTEMGTDLRGHYMLFEENMAPKQLNELYNMAHVGISATGGEGFGLTTLECVAAGVPMIIGNHSTSAEILGDGGQAGSLIDIVSSESDSPNGVQVARAIISAEQAADVLLEYYRRWEADEVPNRRVVRGQVSGRYGVSQMVDAWNNLLIDLGLAGETDGEPTTAYRRVAELDGGEPVSLPEV